jgi:hypothetical protein
MSRPLTFDTNQLERALQICNQLAAQARNDPNQVLLGLLVTSIALLRDQVTELRKELQLTNQRLDRLSDQLGRAKQGDPMKTRTVPSDQLSPHSLRAEDYVDKPDLRHVFLPRVDSRVCHLCNKPAAHVDHVSEEEYAKLAKPEP